MARITRRRPVQTGPGEQFAGALREGASTLSGGWRTVVDQGVYNRYTDFSKGVIDSGHVVFFVAVTAVLVKEGDIVSAGQPVVRIDARDGGKVVRWFNRGIAPAS